MIITVTPSPAIDWTVNVDSFEFAAVNRVASRTREPSGKGINVSVALHRNGVPTAAIFPAGGDTGRFMAGDLRRQGIEIIPVESPRDVRTNITLIVPGQSGTKINEPGEPLEPEVMESLRTACEDALLAADAANQGSPVMLAICGSLPPETPEWFHSGMIEVGRQARAIVIVDASGDVLRRAIPEKPDLIKPNVHELAEETGHSIETLGDVSEAAQELRRRGAGAVLASLGGDGMMLVDADGAIHGTATDIAVVNTVGAGDAALAGYLAGLDQRLDRAACLASALAYASSAVGHQTTLFDVDPHIAERVTVTDAFDRDRRLSEPALAQMTQDSRATAAGT
ncbi:MULTISPECIES: 1-phosphofructokinase family hexose kinase [Arthrobacter]|uniref:1-phosphofructokinase family hexose kinase n=1 Tax=Arthrobacter terricola TaxID=2547396 RepID=A0A4R5K7A3_9MICC|nr:MULTISPECIES: 1-phosphofructokinase family hexose kinase [Arthrobacter]MBT8163451.1 1-phosphofructokinase family hexose kinase [Arthrobacter sp. GN70]TDF89773.1 1-phosphofructokinase family hexose kinase [Arthrobacter terricola]